MNRFLITTIYFLIFLLSIFCDLVNTLSLPSYIKPCHIRDPSFNQCAQKHAMEALPFLIPGDPKYNLPALSPLKIVEIRIEPSDSFHLLLTNITINGLEKGIVEIFDMNWNTFKAYLKVIIPRFEFLSDYKAKFEILRIPVTGTGPFNFTLIDAIFNVDVYMKSVNRNGVKYVDIDRDHLFLQPARVYYHFENLATSNPEISKNLNNILNSNWQLVFEELRQPVSEVMMRVIETFFVGIMERVPQDEIFIP